ncbi:hypothetical protein DENSPDRAFT_162872 [Dentipellis sp. KUC8613]|nr:hypothetical protein DENSPDRAFT_162872 [Dentipellis sp. KUC8613]
MLPALAGCRHIRRCASSCSYAPCYRSDVHPPKLRSRTLSVGSNLAAHESHSSACSYLSLHPEYRAAAHPRRRAPFCTHCSSSRPHLPCARAQAVTLSLPSLEPSYYPRALAHSSPRPAHYHTIAPLTRIVLGFLVVP